VLLIIPVLIVWLTSGTPNAAVLAQPRQIIFWLGLVVIAAGLGHAIWNALRGLRYGQGTPVVWDPPQKLVIRGPYRHVRSPMISGVLLMLLGVELLLQSLLLTLWWLIFLLRTMLSMPKFEECNLLARYGEAYAQYTAYVPCWLPRLQPWTGTDNSIEESEE